MTSSVTEAYLQILYANESLKTNRQTLKLLPPSWHVPKNYLAAGSIAASDYAQIEAIQQRSVQRDDGRKHAHLE